MGRQPRALHEEVQEPQTQEEEEEVVLVVAQLHRLQLVALVS
jgi:hypothetical protein